MPMLSSLGQLRALVAVNAELQEGERLMAFVDDVHVSSPPERTGDGPSSPQRALERQSACTMERPRSGTPKVKSQSVSMSWRGKIDG